MFRSSSFLAYSSKPFLLVTASMNCCTPRDNYRYFAADHQAGELQVLINKDDAV
jgi:hypothetical protein